MKILIKPFLKTIQIKSNKTNGSLVLIIIFSTILKIVFVDFSIPITSDNLTYALTAISFTNGDFSQLVDRSSGWSLFLFPFFYFFQSNDFFSYSNLTRILSIVVSATIIPIVYLLSRQFLSKSFSIISTSMFAFEPHLMYNSVLGLSEPLYSLSIVVSFYFLKIKNSRFLSLSIMFVGLAWWTRINGLLNIIPIFLTSLIFLKSKQYPRNLILGFIFMFLIITPILIQRYEQFGDPFYYFYSDKIFNNDLERMLSINTHSNSLTIVEYVNTKGMWALIENYIFSGIHNMLSTLIRILFPCIIFLIPIGIFFSIHQLIKKKFEIIPLWIFIILSLLTMILTFSIVNERRFLFHLYPFIIIISIFGLEKIFSGYLNQFYLFKKNRNLILTTITIIIISTSILFTFNQFNNTDKVLENEKYLFSKYLIENLEGNVLDDYDYELEYLMFAKFMNDKDLFHNYKTTDNKLNDKFPLKTIRLYGESLGDLIKVGKSYDLKYIISNEQIGTYHPYVDKLYDNYNSYPYLEKVFDSKEHGFEKLKVKVFKINYEK